MVLSTLNRLLGAVLVLLVLATATRTSGHPVPGGGDDSELANSSGGIIQGDEFLSLYINSQQSHGSRDRTSENDARAAESSVHTPVRNRSHDTAAVSVELSAEPADSDDEDSDDDQASLARGSQNVVKLVTRGSRIVFIEDAPAETVDETPVTSVSVTSSEHRASSSSSSDSGDRSAVVEVDSDSDAEDDTDNDMDAKDSMNEASSNFETILQPPPSTTPVETLIVHDKPVDYRGGASRPRSVSYSSVSQQTGTLNDTGATSTAPQRPHVSEPARVYGEPSKVYSEPARNYAEPERIYSEPARVYSEPARVYSEPSRVYSEPAKVYSLPAQNYGEPAKVYGEPAKVYSLPAGSEDNGQPPTTTTTVRPTDAPSPASAALVQNPASTSFHFGVHNVPPAKRIIFNLDKLPYDLLNAPASDADNTNNSAGGGGGGSESVGHTYRSHPLFAPQLDGQRFHQFTRKSYGQQFGALPSLPASSATGDKATAATDGKPRDDVDTVAARAAPASTANGATQPAQSSVAESLPENSPDAKVGFVLEGRNYRKYRVEEKTSDGFIVGEYGVVSNNDGSLRGVRYTADSTISPNLIYETLMKFLSL